MKEVWMNVAGDAKGVRCQFGLHHWRDGKCRRCPQIRRVIKVVVK